MKYDEYNREERALCSHLFRLLHEGLLNDNRNNSALYKFFECILENKTESSSFIKGFSLDNISLDNVGIFAEVALIRDKFRNLKPNV